MTIEEAFNSGRELILTVEPPDDTEPFTVTMAEPVYLTDDGELAGKLKNGTLWRVYAEFISAVELGEEIQ